MVYNNIHSVNDTGNITYRMKIVSVILDDTQEREERNRTQDSEQNVEAEVNTTATVKQDTDGWEDDGNEELADITEYHITH